ncbi:zinc finger BED domain-containing protein RICESLEEPER 2-like protein [Tanacetum coccineum]
MLEKSMYDSWASRIRIFIKGKKNGRMMLDSIDNGPPVYPTVVGEDGQTRPKKYTKLTEAQQLQDDYDVQATNIIIYGLPPDVYSLGETLYEYYWRFYHLINDMHTIGMTMQKVQVNTKFLNALPPEWSKFVNDVKLGKSLYTTNYDQLHAYLSQHERHANEVRIMRERYPDPLALVANSQALYNPSQYPQHSFAVPTFQQGEDPIDCINKAMAFLSVVASRGIDTNSRGNYAAGQARVVKCYNCQEERHMILDEEQLAFLADPGIAEAQVSQQTIPQNLAFQTEDLDTYDSDCDDISSTKVVLMENLSSCDLDVLSKITSDSNIIPYSQYLQESQDTGIQDTNSSAPNDLLVLSMVEQMTNHVANLDKENQSNKMVNESLTAELERYTGHVAIFEQRLNVDLNKREKLIDSQMDDLIRNRNANVIAKKYDVISVIDDEETLILEEESRSKMHDKQNGPILVKHNFDISPIDYSKLNNLKEDFGKCFVTQKELSKEQVLWLKHSNSISETFVKSHTPIRIETPSELSKGSNTTLRNHITHPHCEAIKAQQNYNPASGQTSMVPDRSVFRYDPDYLREQFAGLVIQRALPFNHFDHEQTTRVFQNTMQPRYTHVSRSTLKRDAMKLWLAAKQEIIDSFGNINACVNLTTDVWSAPHGVPGSYMCVTAHWIEPGTWQMMKRVISFEEFPSPHTGGALFKMLIKVLTNFNLEDKVMSITLDNASNNTSAMDKLKLKYDSPLGGRFYHSRCVAHIINLVVQAGLEVPAIDAIRESFKTMLKDIFKSSARTRQCYVKICKDAEKPCLRPNWDVPTRWNSTYHMTDPTMSSEYERYVNSDFVTHLHPKGFATFNVLGFWKEKETMFPVLSRMAMDIISVQASSVASESALSTSGRVLSIRRTRLNLASLEMCMCLKDHLDAKERKQDKCHLEIPLDFEEDVFDDEVQRNEAIPLSDEEIALDASSEGTLSPGGPRYDYMMSSEAEDE